MTRRCPLCRGEAVKDGNKFWPMCSERCHLVDLGKWLGEEYRVPAEPAESEAGSEGLPSGGGDDEHQR
ncbi:MAG: DNA gyrase inhibitor YacG [Deltaproteobacteria bacterium]|nr:DNA gyrase inhibitor YacG [Deltaproteobacteria bacterium]